MLLTLVLSFLVLALAIDRVYNTAAVNARIKQVETVASAAVKAVEDKVGVVETSLRLAISPKLRDLHSRVESLETDAGAAVSEVEGAVESIVSKVTGDAKNSDLAAPGAGAPTQGSTTTNTATGSAGSTTN